MSEIRLEGDRVTFDGLVVEEPALAQLLRAHGRDQWPRLTERALGVGARGLLTMGVAVDLGEIDAKIGQALQKATDAAGAGARRLLEAADEALTRSLDPELRSSLISRAMAEFAGERDAMLAALDPSVADGPSGRLVARLTELVGPNGLVEARLRELLDPSADGSVLASLRSTIDQRFVELRDLVVREQGRSDEAERGTAKGIVFEDVVETSLRSIAKGMGGCIVERTSRIAGSLGADSLVGDFVITLARRQRVVIEAKHQARIGLHGPNGILAELDRAMANRGASAAVCVAATDAFPTEVGPFAAYDRRVLVVDDGSGPLLEAAVRWASALAVAESTPEKVDGNTVAEELVKLRSIAKRCSDQKRALTDVDRSIDKIRNGLEAMRAELLESVDHLAQCVGRSSAEKAVA